VDGKKTGTVAWPALSSNRTAPLKPKEGLSGPPATGPVVVTVNSVPGNAGVVFIVPNPVITSLSPPSAGVGGTVTLNGTDFGPGPGGQGGAQVSINGVVASAVNWLDTSVQVTVPTNATSGPVTLTRYGVASNASQFTLTGQPAVTAVSPTAGPIGSVVTITGSGFGSTQSNSVVDFNGVVASASGWTDTQILAVVPSGATTGPVTIKVAGLTAESSFSINSTVQVTDSAGHTSNYTSVMLGGSWYASDAQGSGCSSCSVRGTIHNDYDGAGNMLATTDELGRTKTYTYDAASNATSQSIQLDASTTATTAYTYNSFGEVLTMTDPLGQVTTNTYDTQGNLLTVTTPAPDASTPASVTHFAYDAKGELTQITDPLNHATTLTYTAAGLIQSITDAQSHVTTYAYDTRGNRTSVIDPINGSAHPTTFAYDAMNRLTGITYPDTTSVSFGYDTRGRRTSVTDQNAKTTTYAYDDADRLITVTDAASHATSYAYDNENNLTSITDASGHLTTFAYDTFGRVTQTAFPSSYAEIYAYDAVGNLTAKTDRKGQVIQYVYDALDRLTHKGYPDSTGVDYVYDLAGKVQQVNDPTGSYVFAYDNMGRLLGTATQYAFLPGHAYNVVYTYDAGSNRVAMQAPDGSTNTYAYDTLNRLATLTNSLTGQFGFGYDGLSRRTQMTRPNGVNTNYGYDSLSRLLSVLHQAGAATLDGASYTYDNAGNRVTKTNQRTSVTEGYTYDPIYQLTGVSQGATTTESYSYDAVGNRLSSLGMASYSYNASNQLTGTASATYTYDNNGNTLTKADGTGTTTSTWDFENRLKQVTLPGAGGTVTFKYDPFGRRIQKSSAGGTTNYIYDGANIIEELDNTGSLLARYTYPLALDEPLAQVRSGSTVFYQADGLGSITSLTTPSSTITATYSYDTSGNLTASTGSITNPFRYAGREFDMESSIYYNRARYYDETLGRFVSEDPVRFSGGLNFYTYVRNDPVSFVDPMGLQCTQVSPWAEIPSIGPPAHPYRVVPDGLYWHRVDWGFATSVRCYCDWEADASRVKAYYHYTRVERAKFECEPCKRIEYKTRTMTEDTWRYEEGTPIMPMQRRRTWGTPYRTDEFADDSPSRDTSGCTCKAPVN
jgi:RHS repeat-associated protein